MNLFSPFHTLPRCHYLLECCEQEILFTWIVSQSGTPSISEDDDTFQFLARKYSFAHHTMRLGNCPKFKDGITNGAEWYATLGKHQHALHRP